MPYKESTYEGYVGAEGDPEGNGIMVYEIRDRIGDKDGAVYMGEFRDGLKHGKGRYVYNDGDIEEGEFVNDKIEG